MAELSRIQVFVENADGEPVASARVQIRAVGEQRFRYLRRSKSPGLSQGEDLSPGTYQIRVSCTDRRLQPEARTAELIPGHNNVVVVLGEKHQPFYYAGETKVYFQPDMNSFLLVTRGDKAFEGTMNYLKQRELEVEPIPSILSPGGTDRQPAAQQPPDTGFVSVKLPGDQTIEQARELMKSVADELRRLGLHVVLALAVRRGEQALAGLTNELVVRFTDDVTREEVREIAKSFGLVLERSILYAGNAFLFSRPGSPSYDLLEIADAMRKDPRVSYAEPNLLYQLEIDQHTPNDHLWANLAYLRLINCDDAWETLGNINTNIQGGSADITIAVFDAHGVTPNHPELTANLTDGTSKLVRSFNFNAMANQTVAQLGGDHGTQCAGSATAAFDNNQGIAGVAPNCHLIGARLPSPATGIEMADAFIWASGFNTGNTNPNFPLLPARSADVISNSWGVTWAALSSALRDCLDFLTVYGRGGRGCIVTFSIGNLGYVQFSNRRTYAAYERTIAVGASINANPTSPIANSCVADPNGNTTNINVAVDTRALYSPYGPELDIVAPSHTTYIPPCNTTNLLDPITSTVRVGTGNIDGCPGATVCNDYAASFGGTSHSSPTVAGAAALVLSANLSLSWVQVREILRTTAVRIDNANTDPIGQYVDNDGDGVNEFSQWYGYGRLDVNAAVIATRDLTNTADIVVRDNINDNGTVPSAGWHAHSPDIWVRRANDPIPTLAYMSAPPHQHAERGHNNYVFCRVKNVGTAASNEVYIRAMITHFPGFEFRYPDEFIPTNRPGDPVPSPLVPGTYLIGEERIDNLAPGADEIVKMTWPTALIPPETVLVGGVNVTWHPCLLLEASPHDGPMPAGATFDIKRDNNIAQRNIRIIDPGDTSSDAFAAIMVGTSDSSGVKGLFIDRSRLTRDARIFIRLSDPHLMKTLVSYAEEVITGKRPGAPAPKKEKCGIKLLTETRLGIQCCCDKMLVITVPPGARFDLVCLDTKEDPGIKIGNYQDLQVIEIGSAQDIVEVPLSLPQNRFTPLFVAVPGSGSLRRGELRLTQRRADGELSAGFSMVVGSDEI